MTYLYETHFHTSEASLCAVNTGAEMARGFKDAGYAGAIVTDHFFNGNTAVDRSLSWDQKVSLFCRGYENCRAEGEKIGIDIFFGFEYNYHGAEFLVYGLDENWLRRHPDCDRYPIERFFEAVHEDDGFIVHAHPFRRVDYIARVLLFPQDIDAVETVNLGRRHLENPVFNQKAREYAELFGLPQTCGSDTHSVAQISGCGTGFDRRLRDIRDFIDLLRQAENRGQARHILLDRR